MSFWVKGNIHTHTTESDGDADPKSVMKWYEDHEYDFLVITDHNHRTIIDFDNNRIITAHSTDRHYDYYKLIYSVLKY